MIVMPHAGSGGSAGSSSQSCANGETCPDGTLCKYDVCIADLGTCASYDDCPGDSYCDADGICVPYGVPAGVVNDPSCERGTPPDGVQPVEQCSWAGPDAADPTIDYIRVYTAPLVADLNLDLDPNKLQPSVALTTWAAPDERIGILRVFDGRTCAEQMRFPDGDLALDPNADGRPAYAAQLAIGDLDGDVVDGAGHPEIVGLMRLPAAFDQSGEVTAAAWEVDDSVTPPVLALRWKGRKCGATPADDVPVSWGTGWTEYGPGLWDIDDDGSPEVVIDKLVFDANGCLLNATDVATLYDIYPGDGSNDHKGPFSTLADVDLDGAPELVRYDGWYDWSGNDWVPAVTFTGDAAKKGHVAVADMGQYSAITDHPATDALPEIIVVSAEGTWNSQSTGSVRVVALDGSVVFGPYDIPHHDCTGNDDCYGGHGGPPTASDFDGDGQVEFAAAANIYYTVFDPDCVSTGVPSERAGGACDNANNPLPPAATADGVLWAQESQDFSSSQTGSSIFDFDGDGKSEAVYRDECNLRVYDGATGSVIFSAPAGSGTGMELPVIADADGDFATEIVVARTPQGNCPSPDPLNAASGAFASAGGFAILRDPDDLWVNSRPIWNQHAYSITHVNDDGHIPATHEVTRNWEVDGLNNFRQNTQGALGVLNLADLTVELADLSALCAGDGGSLELSAKVCNRGTDPVQDGALVAFYAQPSGGGDQTLLCDAETETLLDVGDCTTVACLAEVPASSDVTVKVDPDAAIADCHPGNNDGASSLVLCPTVR